MSGTWGNNIRLTIFGESHGEAIGVVIDGIPAGIKLDLDYIKKEMKRRAPGNNNISTPRKEKDLFNIVSGYFNDYTTGTPLTCIIYNTNQHSRDYDKIKSVMRPGHADYTGYIRYNGHNDYRGGGHFSGRITAPLVFAGAIAKQLLLKRNIKIVSHVKSIGTIKDKSYRDIVIHDELIDMLPLEEIPVLEKGIDQLMRELILKAKEQDDSVGGIIETAIINIPAGIGSPFFDSIESKLSQLLFSIPAVKGVEFGEGFNISSMKGSQANDQYYIEDGVIKTDTNNNGGVLGGITNGMPIVFSTAFKPTPSIGKTQKTVDISTMENVETSTQGRHDPCIVPRAVPVVESVSALALLELIVDKEGTEWLTQNQT